MTKELKISFLHKIKRPKTGSEFVDGLLSILTIPLYPIFLLFVLVVMLFAGLLSLWQRFTTSKEDLQKQKQEILEIENRNKQWNVFTSADSVLIEQQLAGSLPWDSGDYLNLKSNPPISYLTDKLFGDWLLVDFGGVFLQKWNDTQKINCDLVFIDFDTLKVTELETRLPTKHWTTEKLNPDEIKFTFTTADIDLTYIVKRTEVNQNESN
ncbi:hypothetical protein [Solitalea lacus]|uniref:hypothetical protein n=1 Tax=Solitalea lacus TaxID=2911172 RepID=UPI001EDC5D34|nr:hypothetical protein [Solitalea lacus]UKJ06950.1 hypothetical protein L2B55_15640 [Solitalea lacus]